MPPFFESADNIMAATSSSAPNLHTAERNKAIEEAGREADKFQTVFYKTLEKTPHRVAQLYLNTAVLIWDGNPYVNEESIKKFYENLPSVTFHVASMDAQPVGKEAVGDQKTFMITTGGTYRVAGIGSRTFSQTFVITAAQDKWKIASDVFRSQIHPSHA